MTAYTCETLTGTETLVVPGTGDTVNLRTLTGLSNLAVNLNGTGGAGDPERGRRFRPVRLRHG